MNAQTEIDRKFPGKLVAGLAILFIVLRLLVLLSSGTKAAYAEELYRGTIGREILAGLKMPLWDYQADHYSGGSLLTGLGAALFFSLFGPTLFALKLSPLLFALGTLILMAVFMKRYFGSEAALISGLLFILAPPSFVQLSMVAMGFHSESILFSMAVLFFFYRYFFEGRSGRNGFLFGLSAGLAFWFTHITIVTSLTCASAWLLMDRKLLFNREGKKQIFAGFALGLTPWVAYNLTHSLEGLGFIARMLLKFGRPAGEAAPSAFNFDPVRFVRIAFEAVPMSFGFKTACAVPGRVLCFLYYAAGLAMLLPFAIRRSRLQLPLLIQPLIFIGVYWLSSVELTAVADSDSFSLFFDDCRYFVPFHFAFFMAMGLACSGTALKRTGGALLLAFGILSLTSISFRDPWGQVLKYKGYSYSQLGSVRGHIWPDFYPDFLTYMESMKAYDERDRFFLFWNSLYGLQFEKGLRDPVKLKKIIEAVPGERYPQLGEGLGYAFGAQEGVKIDPADPLFTLIPPEAKKYFFMGIITSTLYQELQGAPAYFDYARKLAPEEREWFYFMMGEFCPFGLGQEGADIVAQKRRGETPEEVRAFFRGTGVRCMLYWIVDGYEFRQAFKFLDFSIPAEYMKDFYWGVGFGVRQQVAEDRLRALNWLNELEPAARAEAMKGFIECERIYRIPA